MSELEDLAGFVQDNLKNTSFIVRVCSKCNIEKPYEQYSFCSQTKADKKLNIQRKKAQCRACDSKETLAYRQQDIDKARRNERIGHYSRKYNLSREEAAVLAEPVNRERRCPICNEMELLVMDHNHSTLQTRELICSSCNSAIGYTKESIDTLYSIIAYLKKHKGV